MHAAPRIVPPHRSRSRPAFVLALWVLALAISAQMTSAASAGSVRLEIPGPSALHKVHAEHAIHGGRPALKVTDRATGAGEIDDQMVIVPYTDFRDGEITVELAGDVAPGAPPEARGFVGIAFRVQGAAERFEAFYLRPANARAEDQVRRNHAAQYISHPGFPWYRLREEFPEKYESYVDLVPGRWTTVRIVVEGQTARLYVHGAEQPTLIVNDLKQGASRGAIGLWIGPGTEAHFADLRVSAVVTADPPP